MNAQDQNIVYVFGDSHVTIFVGIDSVKTKAIVAGYSGASITGLNKKITTLDYANHVLNLVNQQPKTYYMMLKMGQVDIEFIIYHKLYVKKEQIVLEDFYDKLISDYRDFITKILKINKNVVIASINLPSYSYTDGIYIRNYIKRIITAGRTYYH